MFSPTGCHAYFLLCPYCLVLSLHYCVAAVTSSRVLSARFKDTKADWLVVVDEFVSIDLNNLLDLLLQMVSTSFKSSASCKAGLMPFDLGFNCDRWKVAGLNWIGVAIHETVQMTEPESLRKMNKHANQLQGDALVFPCVHDDQNAWS